jgi:hypothetical protein
MYVVFSLLLASTVAAGAAQAQTDDLRTKAGELFKPLPSTIPAVTDNEMTKSRSSNSAKPCVSISGRSNRGWACFYPPPACGLRDSHFLQLQTSVSSFCKPSHIRHSGGSRDATLSLARLLLCLSSAAPWVLASTGMTGLGGDYQRYALLYWHVQHVCIRQPAYECG